MKEAVRRNSPHCCMAGEPAWTRDVSEGLCTFKVQHIQYIQQDIYVCLA